MQPLSVVPKVTSEYVSLSSGSDGEQTQVVLCISEHAIGLYDKTVGVQHLQHTHTHIIGHVKFTKQTQDPYLIELFIRGVELEVVGDVVWWQ